MNDFDKHTLSIEESDQGMMFRSLADKSPDMIVRYDRNLRRTYVNHAWEKATGIAAESVLYRSPLELPGLMKSAKPSEYEAKLLTALETGVQVDMEVTLCQADGQDMHVERRIIPEFDDGGDVIGLFSISRDITYRKNNEDMLRIAAAAFETHEAIIITDINANIIRVNQAFQKITGYTTEEVLGKNPRILSAGYHDKVFYEDMWQNILGQGSWTGEIWDKRKNGDIYPKWMTITAVKNEHGQTMQYVGIFSDLSERKKAQEEIANLAFYDSLTKLPNRALLLERFHSALLLSERTNLYGAVLFLDLDRFKLINDTFGHSHGDLLLIEVAERISVCVRNVDTVARLGGDEFVILIEGVGEEIEKVSQNIAHIAEKIRAALSRPFKLNARIHHSSPSIGVCLFRGNAHNVDTLLKQADVAMYQAKDSGRNAVQFYEPEMQRAVEARANLESDLRLAIEKQQFRLYYQIQVDSANRALGAEALIRWQHPLRGMVSPAEFIPVAEESSLILDIGNWVLESACQQLAKWSKTQLTRELSLAVNVSAQQFRQADFVQNIAALLNQYALDASRLKIELTEGVILDDVSDVARKMHLLKSLGLTLSLDDFGTGYSSLSYLKQLPLDQIKIDQSFVRNIAVNSKDAILVQTIVDMARNFGFNVIAEGVETEQQLAFLKHHDCLAYQGYLFSKPVPIDEFLRLLGQIASAHMVGE